jgi:hypothetical protein
MGRRRVESTRRHPYRWQQENVPALKSPECPDRKEFHALE